MSRRIPGRVCTRWPIRRAAAAAVFALLVASCTGQRSAVISPPPSTTEIGEHDLEGNHAREGEQEHDESVTSPEDERSGEVHVHEDGFVHTHGAGAPKEWIVTYAADGEFDPERLDILAGDTVTFANESERGVWPASNIHPTHEIMPEFDPLEPIPPGGSWSHTFTENGYWRYHNHELASEVGLIAVTGGPEQDILEIMGNFEELDFPDPPANADAALLVRDLEKLEGFVRTFGPDVAVSIMYEHELRTADSCHDAAHAAGRIAYEEFGPSVFTVANHDCNTGLLHGVLEAMLAERGTANLKEDITAVCLATEDRLLQANCWHGVGHGLMAWTSYEIHDALELCDLAEEVNGERACFSGVFMENIVGGMASLTGHESEYVLPDDPHLPCTVVEERYVDPCYAYQPVHMLTVFGGDYRSVINTCSSIDDEYQASCFQAIGANVGGRLGRLPATAAQTCGLISDDTSFLYCISGLISELFWQTDEAAHAIAVCNLVEDRAGANECWWATLDRAQGLFKTREERDALCEMFPVGQRQMYCREQLLPEGSGS